MSEPSTVAQNKALYRLPAWSGNYFHINDAGLLCVGQHPLTEIVDQCRSHGYGTPLLLRFPDLLIKQAEHIQNAFQQAIEEQAYEGQYRLIYPIKVNQQSAVVRTLAQSQALSLGLEAGSKAELLAVMSESKACGTIVCNGYKDDLYIRLALSAQKLGMNTWLVMEKPGELEKILRIAGEMNIRPQLGIRLRLHAIAHGQWQNSGGSKAKFGLSPSQIMQVMQKLAEADMLDCLQMIHFHMGSQIANIRDIKKGMAEASRYMHTFSQRGCHIRIVDVGGGLGIDYEGSASRDGYSINYSYRQYANAVVSSILTVCQQYGLPQPDIFTESGRAVSAHHAVLVTRAHDVARQPVTDVSSTGQAPQCLLLRQILELQTSISQLPAEEVYHESEHLYDQGQLDFQAGTLSLDELAELEKHYYALSMELITRLNPEDRRQREIRDQLREKLADKLFLNFSVFRSIPDSWAIDQTFPIMPLQRLDQPCSERAMIEDLTCDSDGRVDAFIQHHGVQSTLPVHKLADDEDYLLGIFLVGAYQEVLGDNHNLFGLPHAVDVAINGDELDIRSITPGDNIIDVLAEVHYPGNEILDRLENHIAESSLESTEASVMQRLFEDLLSSYTYLV